MTMTAERVSNSSADEYENPFADLPAYEEMRQQNNKTEEEPVTAERHIVHRKALKTGERSTIYQLEMSDGKEGTEVDSYYIDATSNFKKQHESLKNNFDVSLAMAGFSTDLAIIDATKGECFRDANPNVQKDFLADYGKLRSFMESPTTSTEDKQLIADYLGQMQGNAYNFLENEYNQSISKNEQSEKIKADLEELKDMVERRRRDHEETYGYYEKAAATIDEILQDSHYYDELPMAINKLKRAIEDAIDAAKSFRQANDNYGDATMRFRNQLNEDEYSKTMHSYEDDDDAIKQALKVLDRADDYAHDLARKVSNMGY
jgi:hypothetical protein